MPTTSAQQFPDDTPSIFRFLGITEFLRWRVYFIGASEITPEQAGYLWSLKHSNRTFNVKQAKKYSDDMRAGRWTELSSAMFFSGERMVDGQTRANALTLSQTTQSFLVVVRPDDDSGQYDIGYQRRVSDFLDLQVAENFQGMTKFAIAATTPALGIYFLWAHGSSEEYQMRSRMKEVELLDRERDMVVFAVQCRRNWKKQHGNEIPSGALAGLLECWKYDAMIGTHYADAITTERNVSEESAAYRVTRWIASNIGKARKQPTIPAFWNVVVAGFDYFRVDRRYTSVRVPSDTFLRPKGGA